ncbi:hypothetical protein [uncultured Paracoccus sp.]|uniref:hypothetical protein n=1 Tax=uncultured Paracoccus sp. TaxID=189685 RepID=UPI00262A9932|nr:hypothetical protein [uncultured Paracoccus sp.]
MSFAKPIIPVAFSLAIAPASTVSAHPIDCAILLCLSGGWPASAECTAARAEFIRRITPWPIEPPLQIWRCPMNASFHAETPGERIWSISATVLPAQTYTPQAAVMRDMALQLAGGRRANVDISGPTYDFVRSIKVYDIDWYAWAGETSNGEREVCHRPKARKRLGSYGVQGDFDWAVMDITAAPEWLNMNLYPDGPCEAAGRFRGVGVEWTDYFGQHGFELVRY